MLPVCQKWEKCSNFKFNHCSASLHPLRIKECNNEYCQRLNDLSHTQLFNHTKQYEKICDGEQYFLSHLIQKKCPKWNQCEDYGYDHCTIFDHPIRKKFCVYYNCKLSHDINHMLEYYHGNIYGHVQISKNNYNYNLTHPIFGSSDIWSMIHSFLFDDEDYGTINALLYTSKLFREYIKINNDPLDIRPYVNYCEIVNNQITYKTKNYCIYCLEIGGSYKCYCYQTSECPRCGEKRCECCHKLNCDKCYPIMFENPYACPNCLTFIYYCECPKMSHI